MRTSSVRLAALALTAAAATAAAPAGAQQKQLYVVSTAHLDTQWRWTIVDTILAYIPATMRDQLALIDQYPEYVFSFEGAYRYMLMQEYYPADYERVKQAAQRGQWRPVGSSIDAGDLNLPAPESIIRHILYGNRFFKRELGRAAADIFLPDSFGFPGSLPTIAAHCGLKGFSTQKLTWGAAAPIPFDIGVWEGPDGSQIVAALNPGDYNQQITGDLSVDPAWLARVDATGEQCGAYVGYKYFGVGDRGGAPSASSVDWLAKAMANTSAPLKVVSAAADQLYLDLPPETIARLPRYKGELLMTTHGTGCYTSQAHMKRYNRDNESLADAAERAAIVADWLGGSRYPKEQLTAAWIRFLWHQFHDDLTGTSIFKAYGYSWTDELLSRHQFGGIVEHAVRSVSTAMDTSAQGVPVVVFNPLSIEREDLVRATLDWPNGVPAALRVVGPDGERVPAQIIGPSPGGPAEVLFVARLPALGFAVYDVQPLAAPAGPSPELVVSSSGIENAKLRVTVDAQGEISGVFDKIAGREVLAGGAALQLLVDRSEVWPAWEITHAAVSGTPRPAGAKQAVRVVESGPARATLEVTRQGEGSTFVQRLTLAAGGAGDHLGIETDIDWNTRGALLKAAFGLAIANPTATYDLGVGVAERGTNTPKLHEVPGRRWADVTAEQGDFGVAILSADKHGWDRPAAGTLRLTLLHTPDTGTSGYIDQSLLDLGQHQTRYAIAPHRGDWRAGDVVGRGARLSQPLLAWPVAAHAGALGKSLSFAQVSSPQVAITALKQAEDGDELVLRLQETWGRDVSGVKVTFLAPITSARAVDGAENELGAATLADGALVVDLKGFQPRAYALRLGAPPARIGELRTQPVELPYDADVVSSNANRADGDLDGSGQSIPAELLPEQLEVDGVPFRLGPTGDGQNNALICAGQRFPVPPGYDHVDLLAPVLSVDLGEIFTQRAAGVEAQLLETLSPSLSPADETPAVRADRLAWVGTHRHSAEGEDLPYALTYVLRFRFPLPAGATAFSLPEQAKMPILALTFVRGRATEPAQPATDGGVAADGGTGDGGTGGDDTGGGCGCFVLDVDGAATGAGLAACIVALALWRRRRARRPARAPRASR